MTAGDVTAPAIVLENEEGQEVRIPAPGRPTVLVFYRGDW